MMLKRNSYARKQETVILKKDKDNSVIGFEKLNLLIDKNVNVPIEVTAT